MDLDAIPFQARDYMEEDWFKNDPFKMVNLMGSRGCHGHCHFAMYLVCMLFMVQNIVGEEEVLLIL